MELESAIQELISRLEFVSLPGLGSFVKKYEPATPTANGFNPPREYYTFDNSRNFNDEALENFISSTSNVDHKKASAVVSEYIDNIKLKLRNGEHVNFCGVGTLKQNAEGIVELIPFEETLSKTFGLGKIDVTKKEAPKSTVEPISTKANITKQTKVEESKVVETKKVKARFLLPIALIFVIIASAALILFVPTLRFWEDGSSAEFEEKVINEKVTEGDELPTGSSFAEQVQDSVSLAPITEEKSESTGNVVVIDKKAALYYQEVKTENKSYYIIVGSFTNENNAQKLIQDLSAKGYKPILLQNDSMFRVAVYKFTNRDRALRELERLKTQKLSEKVWLLSL